MTNLTEEQIQLYQAFSRLMPGDQFVSSSGTVAVIEAIQGMIDASLLKDKAQSVNNAEPLLTFDKEDPASCYDVSRDNLLTSFQDVKMKEALRKIADFSLRVYHAPKTELEAQLWISLTQCVDLARSALGEKKDG